MATARTATCNVSSGRTSGAYRTLCKSVTHWCVLVYDARVWLLYFILFLLQDQSHPTLHNIWSRDLEHARCRKGYGALKV